MFPTTSLLALALTAAGIGEPPPAAHSIAIVNDTRSHGQVGDSKLSLNEVIQLNQRSLLITQLSTLEQQQILGMGPDVAWADIDATSAPQITFERDLDVINDMPHGFVVSSSNGRPTLLIGNTKGFEVNSNFCNFLGLELRGGATAITVTQTDTIYGTIISSTVFSDQTDTAVKVTLNQDDSATHIEFDQCQFLNAPKAIEIFDTGANRSGSLAFKECDIQGGQQGIGIHLGPAGALDIRFERVDITGATNGIIVDRQAPLDSRSVNLSGLFLRVRGAADGFSFQSHAAAADSVTLRMVEINGTNSALRLWPIGTQLQAIIDDSRLSGPIDLLAGTGAGIDAGNLRISSSNLSVGSTNAPLRITDSILDNVNTTTQGNAALQIDASRFIGGAAAGTAAAAIDVQGCHLGGVTVGNHVNVSGSLPAPQLGAMEMSPLQVSLGGQLTLQSDLPPGLSGVWMFGVAETLPFIGPRPFHIYVFTSAHVILPVSARLQSSAAITVPVQSVLVGWSFVTQLVVFPDPGTVAPALSIPPGRRTTVR